MGVTVPGKVSSPVVQIYCTAFPLHEADDCTVVVGSKFNDRQGKMTKRKSRKREKSFAPERRLVHDTATKHMDSSQERTNDTYALVVDGVPAQFALFQYVVIFTVVAPS